MKRLVAVVTDWLFWFVVGCLAVVFAAIGVGAGWWKL